MMTHNFAENLYARIREPCSSNGESPSSMTRWPSAKVLFHANRQDGQPPNYDINSTAFYLGYVAPRPLCLLQNTRHTHTHIYMLKPIVNIIHSSSGKRSDKNLTHSCPQMSFPESSVHEDDSQGNHKAQ